MRGRSRSLAGLCATFSPQTGKHTFVSRCAANGPQMARRGVASTAPTKRPGDAQTPPGMAEEVWCSHAAETVPTRREVVMDAQDYVAVAERVLARQALERYAERRRTDRSTAIIAELAPLVDRAKAAGLDENTIAAYRDRCPPKHDHRRRPNGL